MANVTKILSISQHFFIQDKEVICSLKKTKVTYVAVTNCLSFQWLREEEKNYIYQDC